MRKLFLILAVCSSMVAMSQENAEQPPKPVEVKWSGFLMNNMFYDTRKNFEALDGLLVLFPLPEDTIGAMGKDLNAVPNLNLLSFAARLRTAITGPDAFGAATSGLIEFDFTSKANSAVVRFRHAWVKLAWDKTDLLVGRTWHPLVSTDVVPTVNALSWGAPFQPFNRSDQITVTRKGNKLSVLGSVLFQNDYTISGPLGKTYLYQTNTLLPNLHAQVKYKSDVVTAGLGADYKRIMPRIFTTSPVTSLKHTTKESFGSYALLAFAQVKSGKLTVGSKTIYSTNVSESLMAGAFGISSLDSLTGREEYTPYKHWSVWGNVMYGAQLKAGVFAGYFKNLGATQDLHPGSVVYGLGEKIAHMYRITPMVSYTSGKAVLAAETEYNAAFYGKIDHADKGKVKGAKKIEGFRALITLYYFF